MKMQTQCCVCVIRGYDVFNRFNRLVNGSYSRVRLGGVYGLDDSRYHGAEVRVELILQVSSQCGQQCGHGRYHSGLVGLEGLDHSTDDIVLGGGS
jgi:hypothetical protein